MVKEGRGGTLAPQGYGPRICRHPKCIPCVIFCQEAWGPCSHCVGSYYPPRAHLDRLGALFPYRATYHGDGVDVGDTWRGALSPTPPCRDHS